LIADPAAERLLPTGALIPINTTSFVDVLVRLS